MGDEKFHNIWARAFVQNSIPDSHVQDEELRKYGYKLPGFGNPSFSSHSDSAIMDSPLCNTFKPFSFCLPSCILGWIWVMMMVLAFSSQCLHQNPPFPLLKKPHVLARGWLNMSLEYTYLLHRSMGTLRTNRWDPLTETEKADRGSASSGAWD
jgi:hypothetical protein